MTSSLSGPKSRRVPPPCWTQEETVALINAYKDKWFALRRGNLRASDWDAVADAVSSGSSSPKSSIQCRHKIEKLRKRYRAEKQRCLNHPGKFSSSWDLFPLLDAMGFASTLAIGSNDPDHDDNHEKINAVGGFRLKSKKVTKVDEDLNFNLDFDHDFGGGFGLGAASRSREKSYFKFNEDFQANADFDRSSEDAFSLKRKRDGNFNVDGDFGDLVGVKLQGGKGLVPQGIRSRSYAKTDDRSNSIIDSYHSVGGFPVKTLGDRSMVRLGCNSKNYSNIDGSLSPNLDYNHHVDGKTDRGGELGLKFSSDWDSVPPVLWKKSRSGTDENLNPNAEFRVSNGLTTSSRSGYWKSGGHGVKREQDPLEEMASSIKMLADVFVKMEKMKMEMARGIEKMRMEMELKNSQMILESQQQIVNTFAEALLERTQKKKVKVILSPNATGNGEAK